jgi:hypothetical protein
MGPTPLPEKFSMRKIVAELFSSLDGVVTSPDQWHGPYHNEEMEQDISATYAINH